ncbi:hypothetical protein ASH01_15880 [Terrabacter sp. Soil811]|uniref:MauE/DoxX family redox-associated membrane protein n=1 Tax=Terrabacter sp. Soil811 TaxID=1736419 RepID=UPI0006F5A02C|nr:MauE/DoxX family redox-associated membrane protein [Terrabacter sp. Soil811]KRF43277.1 hypothetical protein ASH01_15880 [Terrabacter sp. Soil811]
MPTDALALAPVILAVVLVVSAVGKLRSPSASKEAFRDLRVPAPLRNRVVVEGLPWGELLLAALLLLVGGPVGTLAAVAALLLFTAYLGLVVRALGFDEDVDCACFGEFAPGRITTRTVVRNAWLVLMAVLTTVVAAQGASVVARVADGRLPWWWLLGALAVAVSCVLVLGRSAPIAETPGAHNEPNTIQEEEGDYLRYRTPALPVVLGDGSETDLRSLSAERAQLLLFVSETCGPCTDVIAATPGWREQLPEIDIRHVVTLEPGVGSMTSTATPLSVHDPLMRLPDSFGFRGTPAALLLGADGLLAGGPVIGSDAVPEFVADVLSELRAAARA